MLGSTILHYQIVEKIGSGGMGEIYKARDPRLNRFVAIKVLNPTVSRDEDRRRRFFQEAQAASALNHPNIITIYDIIPDGPVECIVMEYVSGKSLAELIPGGGMSAPLVVRLGVQIASALTAAHAAAIVHRDLKPGNIMVTESARVKVLDFGLAKLLDSGPVSAQTDETKTVMGKPMTIEGSIIGTVSYMSPEQAQGKRIDARTDIFSFGTVLYEMATGKRAFEGENTLSTLTAVLRDETRPVADFVKDSPPEFDHIVRRCMRKNPEDRYQSIQDVEDALAALKQSYDSGSIGGPPPSVIASTMATPPGPLNPSDPNAPNPFGHQAPPYPPHNPASSVGGPMHVDPSAYQQGAYPPSAQPNNPPSYPPPMQGPPPSMAPEPPAKKKGSPLGLIAGLVVVLGAAAGGGYWFFTKDKKPAEPVAQNTAPSSPAPAPTPVVETPAPTTPPVAENPPPTTPPENKATTPDNKGTQKAASKTADPKAADPKATQKSAPIPAPVAPPPTTPTPAPPKTEVKPAVPVPVPASAPTRIVPLPDATPFSVTLTDDIPQDAEEGLALHFVAKDDLKVGGAVVIAKGAPVTGAIFEGKKKKVLGMGGKMTLRMLQAQIVDGRKVNVRATSGTRGDGPARRAVDAPGVKTQKNVAAAKGSEYVAYIDGDVVVTVKQ